MVAGFCTPGISSDDIFVSVSIKPCLRALLYSFPFLITFSTRSTQHCNILQNRQKDPLMYLYLQDILDFFFIFHTLLYRGANRDFRGLATHLHLLRRISGLHFSYLPLTVLPPAKIQHCTLTERGCILFFLHLFKLSSPEFRAI